MTIASLFRQLGHLGERIDQVEFRAGTVDELDAADRELIRLIGRSLGELTAAELETNSDVMDASDMATIAPARVASIVTGYHHAASDGGHDQ